LYICSVHTPVVADTHYLQGKIYSCQIYDNGVPVRCFVPCINPSGEVGLYDAIFHKFSGNAGTGSFTGEEFPEATLPDGYQRVEYIESTGTQYVDTRFAPNQDSKLEIMFQTAQTDSGGIAVCDTAWKSNCFGIWCNAAGYGNDATLSVAFYGSEPIVAVLNKNKLYKDGNLVWTATESTFQTTHPLTLMALRINGAMNEYLTGKLYYCKLWDNGTLIRNYIPCVELATGKAGLYDLVNGTFSASAGSGAFISGPVVNTGIYEEPEITFLEYIESTGGQYVDTRFAPNQDTRIVCDLDVASQSIYPACLLGEQNSTQTSNLFSVWIWTATRFRTDYGANTNNTNLDASTIGRYTVDKNKNVTTINGVSVTCAAETWSTTYPIYLFSNNYNHTPDDNLGRNLVAKMYSTQIYDDGTAIRDYWPARTSDGDVGLYDQVDGLFYPNVGTGVFLAGPEVEQTPAAPTGFAASVEGDKVTLRWDAKDEVLGYRVYRDGLLLADTTATEIEDTVMPFVRTTYFVTAYNDLGEGKAASVVLYVVPEIPVLYLVTDRTAEDVAAGNAKGIYTATDLARVNTAMDYVQRLLTGMGYACPVTLDTDWADEEWATPATMDLYLRNLATIRGVLTMAGTTPAVPEGMSDSETGKKDGLTYTKANDIEQILVDVYDTILLIKQQAVPCGAAECGGEYL